MLLKEVLNQSFPYIRDIATKKTHDIIAINGYECRECHAQAFESHLNAVRITDVEAKSDNDYIVLCDSCLKKRK